MITAEQAAKLQHSGPTATDAVSGYQLQLEGQIRDLMRTQRHNPSRWVATIEVQSAHVEALATAVGILGYEVASSRKAKGHMSVVSVRWKPVEAAAAGAPEAVETAGAAAAGAKLEPR